MDRVFAKGRMHELAGKSVEVKRATPKGSGPSFGRGIPMQRRARIQRFAAQHSASTFMHVVPRSISTLLAQPDLPGMTGAWTWLASTTRAGLDTAAPTG